MDELDAPDKLRHLSSASLRMECSRSVSSWSHVVFVRVLCEWTQDLLRRLNVT
jgi:hypothetical protein